MNIKRIMGLTVMFIGVGSALHAAVTTDRLKGCVGAGQPTDSILLNTSAYNSGTALGSIFDRLRKKSCRLMKYSKSGCNAVVCILEQKGAKITHSLTIRNVEITKVPVRNQQKPTIDERGRIIGTYADADYVYRVLFPHDTKVAADEATKNINQESICVLSDVDLGLENEEWYNCLDYLEKND